MKRPVIYLVSALLAVTAVCTLAGCGSDNAASTVQETSAAQSSAQESAADVSAAASISEDDARLTVNGTSIGLNQNAEEVIASLGEPNSTSSQLTCHGTTGDDKTYTYDGFVINTYPVDGQDYILEIVVNSEQYPTSKGVKVGDSVSAVTDAYGTGYRQVGFYYAYDAGDGKSLQFFVENDVVTEIDYYYDV